MCEDIPLPFDLPAVARKNVSAAFDDGRITSDGGIMLLAKQSAGWASPINSSEHRSAMEWAPVTRADQRSSTPRPS